MAQADPGGGAPAPSTGSERVGRICLVAVELAADAADAVAAALSRRVAVPCEVSVRPDLPRPPRVGQREQHDADVLLRTIEALDGGLDTVLVGITGLDLAIPIFTHVFGRAVLGGRVALVSLARLTPEFYGQPPDPALTLERGVTEILHELGHVAGLGHCPDRGCIMSFVPNVESLDLRGHGFCASCEPSAARRIPLASVAS
ncbi:MAG: hypothetical protein IPK07_25550 [Deltaproteobacteria bacterium]|jgi:archaemetzincin|nr:hypothetical protein [Deltaproteobacteria bacterium]